MRPTAQNQGKSPSSTTSTRLANALQARATTLVYDVTDVTAFMAAVEKAANKKLIHVDARGNVAAAVVQTALAKQVKAGGPVLVLLGTEISDAVRAALSSVLEADGAPMVLALTGARAPSETMAALFPLQMAAARALMGGH
jgi:hypothetical protein